MGSLGKERILVVDDEPQVLVALEDTLGEEFNVFTASSGAGALNLLEQEPDIAVVITDQRMPSMTGDELLARLRGSSRALTILLTGFADLSAVIRAVNDGGIFAYVTKPWDAPDLRLKVEKAAEHFRLEQHLEHERQLLHDLMDNIPDGIYFKDQQLRLLRVNRAFAEFLDAGKAEEHVGKRFTDLPLDERVVADIEASEREVIESGSPVTDSLRRVAHEDGEFWFSNSTAPVKDPNGNVIGVVGISRNVTERVRAIEALEHSESRLRKQSQLLNAILDSMGEGLVAVDAHGSPVLLTPSARRLLGVTESSVPLAEWPRALGLYEADETTELSSNDQLLRGAGSSPEGVEKVVFVKNARVDGRLLAMHSTVLRDDQGTRSGGLLVMRDVTQQRRLEQQLLQAQKMEAIGLLAGGIAHDFNNLLSVMTSYGDLMLQDLPTGSPMRSDVTEMLEAARRAAALTRQLLAFSRRQVVEPRVLDLNEMVLDGEKMLKRILGEDIALKVVLSSSLGRIRVDASQLEQIILNLCVNARDAMPKGGHLTIETANVPISLDYVEERVNVKPGEYVMLAVTDTGSGMDQSTQKHIFEPFYTTKPFGQGTGLGLSTVYGITTQAGGYVEVYSKIGMGTTFKVYFPRVDAVANVPAREAVELPGAESRATILVVEDDEAVRRVAMRILERCGYEVLETRTAGEAHSICRERGGEIDLLLTDIVMPDVNGVQLSEELSRVCPTLRTLFISGYPGGAVSHGGVLKDGVAFLSKPFAPVSLANKVREVLEARASSPTP